MIPCLPPRKNRAGRRKAWDEEYREWWRIERTFAWVGNFRRLLVRYERQISVYAGFLTVACILICLRMVVKWFRATQRPPFRADRDPYSVDTTNPPKRASEVLSGGLRRRSQDGRPTQR